MRKIPVVQALVSIAVLALQEYVVRAGIISDLYLAAPSQIVAGLFELLKGHVLIKNLWVTLLEFLAGFAASILVGVGFGIVMATVPSMEQFLRPFISMVMAIPKVALVPLLTIWFGLGFRSKAIMVFIFGVFSILHNTVAGVKQVSESHLKVARSFGATKWQIVTKVLLPSALPTIFAGVRVAAATGFVGALFSEMLASKEGLGNLLVKASQLYKTGQLFAIILVVTLLSTFIVWWIDFLEKSYFLRWKSGKEEGLK